MSSPASPGAAPDRGMNWVTTTPGRPLGRVKGVNVGFARLWYDTPKEGEQLDQAPVNKAAPFQLGSSNAWFIAASFNMGGGGK